MTTLWCWRHPRAMGTVGRCIGRTDAPVDPRRAKRLAHRVRATARVHGLPREVWTSPLARCHRVGRWLRRWGWRHRVDERLLELDFGAWDGRPWRTIDEAEVAAWEAAFATHAPGGGESLQQMRARLRAFVADLPLDPPRLLIAHAGCMQLLATRACATPPCARDWPTPPRHNALQCFDVSAKDFA